LLREEKGIAAQVLIDAGVTLDRARAEMLRILGTEMTPGGATGQASTTPPQGATPIGVRVILRYDNGAVVTKNFSSAAEAANFLTTQ